MAGSRIVLHPGLELSPVEGGLVSDGDDSGWKCQLGVVFLCWTACAYLFLSSFLFSFFLLFSSFLGGGLVTGEEVGNNI